MSLNLSIIGYRIRMAAIRTTPLVLVLSSALASGCQGQLSAEPPIHPQRNMFNQDRYDHQEKNEFYADKRALRPLPQGVVANGALKEDSAFFRGVQPAAPAKVADGKKPQTPAPSGPVYVTQFPLEVNADLLKQGERRFNTYCTPCHGPTGAGGGMVVQRGYPIATSIHEDRIRTMPAGEIFNTVSNGIRNMPGYSSQIDERDRWAIVAYVRALQRSQNGKIEDVPESQRASLGPAPTAGSDVKKDGN